MTLIIEDVPTQGGGWFKPADHEDAVAFLVEVKGFERQRPTDYGPKDSALCDISVFPTEAELEAGTPTVLAGTRVESTLLARDLAPLQGKATIVTLGKTTPKKQGQHPGWVWRPAPAGVKAKVATYAQEREAKIQAAVAAAPSFD